MQVSTSRVIRIARHSRPTSMGAPLMHEDGHPSLDQLVALITAGENDAAQRLVSECALCREHARWVRWVLGTARADRLTAPPPAVLQRAIDIFATGRSRAAEPVGGLRRLIGTLVFD